MSKRATADFINFAICLYPPLLVEFLTSHGIAAAANDLQSIMTGCKTLAARIGAAQAKSQLEAMRNAAAAALAAKCAVALADARARWVAGDAKAFDEITW
jgi:hypothetical protein